jgi:hypothetical protein
MKKEFCLIFILLCIVSLSNGEIVLVGNDYSSMNITKSDLNKIQEINYNSNVIVSYGLGFYLLSIILLIVSIISIVLCFIFGIIVLYLIVNKIEDRKKFFK